MSLTWSSSFARSAPPHQTVRFLPEGTEAPVTAARCQKLRQITEQPFSGIISAWRSAVGITLPRSTVASSAALSPRPSLCLQRRGFLAYYLYLLHSAHEFRLPAAVRRAFSSASPVLMHLGRFTVSTGGRQYINCGTSSLDSSFTLPGAEQSSL